MKAGIEARCAHELALLARIASATGSGGWELDLASNRLRWTREMYALHEVDPAAFEPTLDGARAPYSAEARAQIDAAARAAIVDGAGWDLELPFTTARGRALWVRSRGQPVRSGDRCVALVGTLEDVSAARAARLRQEELNERLRVAADLAGLGLFMRDLRTGLGEWSEQAFALYGFAPAPTAPTRAELLARIHPDDRDAFMRSWYGADERAELRSADFRVLRDDGVAYIHTRGVVERDAEGRPARLVGMALDVTRERRAEQQMREAHQRLALATSSAELGVYARDARTGIGYWDPAVFRMFGLPERDCAPDPAEILAAVHPDDRAAYVEAAAASRTSREFLLSEVRTVHRDGSVRWVQIRGRREGDRTAGVAIDITAQKAAEAEARAALLAKEAAERANAAKSEFLSRMSHELRTPLNAILGFAQILGLKGGASLSEQQRGHLAQIEAAGWHLLTLINEVLDLSRIESGRAAVELTAVALGPLLDECIALTSPDAARRSIRVERADAPDAPDSVRADPTRLKQVLLNLLSNAVKYNRDGGEVVMRVARSEAGGVAISVRDTGRGMTAPQLETLFQPFNRLGLETSPIEGTGIGLTISKKLAELMGGELRVASRAGVGSEFTLVLPQGAAA